MRQIEVGPVEKPTGVPGAVSGHLMIANARLADLRAHQPIHVVVTL